MEEPGALKRAGRQIKNFYQEIWDRVAGDIVHNGNLHKFLQNITLLKALKDTSVVGTLDLVAKRLRRRANEFADLRCEVAVRNSPTCDANSQVAPHRLAMRGRSSHLANLR